MDDAAALEEYNVQLQQVEAALAADPANEELKKLQFDLLEVIALTQELVPSQAQAVVFKNELSSEASGHDGPVEITDIGSDQDSDEEFAQCLTKPLKEWKVGETCFAKSNAVGRYVEAIIKEIEHDQATVQFVGVPARIEVKKLVQLQFPPAKAPWPKSDARRNQFQMDREKRLKKARRKAEKIQELEQAKEQEKLNWKQFNNRAVAKQMKGVKKASIFASPESTIGKVGVGTCGSSGKGATKTSAPKGYIRAGQRGFQ